MTKSTIRTWVRDGWLLREHGGVYIVGHRPVSRDGTFRGALMALGEDAVLSYRAAGGHWDIIRGAVPSEVTIPLKSGRSHRDGIIVHRSLLLPHDVVIHRGLRVTSLVRTHLDLADPLELHELERVFERAQVEHRLDPNRLAVEMLSRTRRPGNRKLKLILVDAVDPAKVRSLLELRFLELCAAYGIPRPLVNEAVGPWTLDFVWGDAWLVVETDGARFHSTAAQRRRDAERDAWLEARGYVVIRLSWQDVSERAPASAARVRAALQARGVNL